MEMASSHGVPCVSVTVTTPRISCRLPLPASLPEKLAPAANAVNVDVVPTAVPTVLFAGPDAIRREVRRVLASFGAFARDGARNGHVFNLGHGISQFTPPEHVAELVAAVHTHSRVLRASSLPSPTQSGAHFSGK